MKEIEAIIHPHRVQNVIHALRALAHFPGLTLTEGRGEGRGMGAGGAYTATEEVIDIHPRTVIRVVCADEIVSTMTETIRNAAHTGNKGDGIITVRNLEAVIRIRTGEENDSAV